MEGRDRIHENRKHFRAQMAGLAVEQWEEMVTGANNGTLAGDGVRVGQCCVAHGLSFHSHGAERETVSFDGMYEEPNESHEKERDHENRREDGSRRCSPKVRADGSPIFTSR